MWQRHFPNTTEMCLNLSQVSSVGRYTLLIRIWPHLFITGWKVGTIFGWFQPTETNWIKFKMWITFFHSSSFERVKKCSKILIVKYERNHNPAHFVVPIEYISDGNQIEVTCKRSTFFAFLLMFLGQKKPRTTPQRF